MTHAQQSPYWEINHAYPPSAENGVQTSSDGLRAHCRFSIYDGRFAIDTMMIDYVSAFVQQAAGEKFNPHVSTGTAPRADLDKLLAEPFTPFTFSPAGAAVYRLGPYGTAAKKLKEFVVKR